MRPAATSGGDALSGLARAFYAVARALLVSHRYVDSNATVALITKFFDPLKADPRSVGPRPYAAPWRPWWQAAVVLRISGLGIVCRRGRGHRSSAPTIGRDSEIRRVWGAPSETSSLYPASTRPRSDRRAF